MSGIRLAKQVDRGLRLALKAARQSNNAELANAIEAAMRLAPDAAAMVREWKASQRQMSMIRDLAYELDSIRLARWIVEQRHRDGLDEPVRDLDALRWVTETFTREDIAVAGLGKKTQRHLLELLAETGIPLRYDSDAAGTT